MPLPFIIAGLVAAASSVGAAAATAVGTAAAAAGAAGAAAAAAAGTAGAAIAATAGSVAVTAGAAIAAAAAGVTLATASAVFAGVVITGVVLKKLEEAKDEGVKEGYRSASREYEEKLQRQADAFFRQMKEAEEQRDRYREDRERAMRMADDAFRLLGQYEGCIRRLAEEGVEPSRETMERYGNLAAVIESLREQGTAA